MSQNEFMPEKPTRTFSKRITGACMVAAWATIWLSMWLGVGMATIVVPVMIAAILGLSSAYQAVGHFDLRALAEKVAVNNRANTQNSNVGEPDYWPRDNESAG